MAEERAKFQEADADKDLSGLWRVSGCLAFGVYRALQG